MRSVTLKKLIDAGYQDRLCPSHDCICLAVLKENADGSMPEEHEFARHNQHAYLYIKREVIPDLKEMGVADATIETLFVDNPRRFFRGS
jgi:predicted metal-dependent phosphotriesterase family hydrolase